MSRSMYVCYTKSQTERKQWQRLELKSAGGGCEFGLERSKGTTSLGNASDSREGSLLLQWYSALSAEFRVDIQHRC
jgi:hypothetical protein